MITARHEYMERTSLISDLSFEGDKGVTKQSDLKETDINMIMKRFERTGQLPAMIKENPVYGDFSSVPDYQEAKNIVNLANEQFANLDVDVRNKFSNDPAAFLAFVTDQKNTDELERLGLLKPEVVKAREEARAKKAQDAHNAEEAKKATQAPAQ